MGEIVRFPQPLRWPFASPPQQTIETATRKLPGGGMALHWCEAGGLRYFLLNRPGSEGIPAFAVMLLDEIWEAQDCRTGNSIGEFRTAEAALAHIRRLLAEPGPGRAV